MKKEKHSIIISHSPCNRCACSRRNATPQRISSPDMCFDNPENDEIRFAREELLPQRASLSVRPPTCLHPDKPVHATKHIRQRCRRSCVLSTNTIRHVHCERRRCHRWICPSDQCGCTAWTRRLPTCLDSRDSLSLWQSICSRPRRSLLQTARQPQTSLRYCLPQIIHQAPLVGTVAFAPSFSPHQTRITTTSQPSHQWLRPLKDCRASISTPPAAPSALGENRCCSQAQQYTTHNQSCGDPDGEGRGNGAVPLTHHQSTRAFHSPLLFCDNRNNHCTQARSF